VADAVPVVGFVGPDVPVEILRAAGIQAERLQSRPGPTPLADEVAEVAIDRAARSVLDQLLDGSCAHLDAVVIGHDSEASARVFHYAAECRHLGIGFVPPVVFVDLLHSDRPGARAYNLAVIAHLRTWAGEVAGRSVTDDDLREAIERAAASLVERPSVHGRRLVLTGSSVDDPSFVRALEDGGWSVVAADHDEQQRWPTTGLDPSGDPLDLLVDIYANGAPFGGRHSVAARAAYTASVAVEASADAVLALLRQGDDGPPWDVPAQRAALAAHDIPLVSVRMVDDLDRAAADALEALDHAFEPPERITVVEPEPDAGTAPTPGGERPARAPRPKGLEASAIATAYQREWFAEMREEVAAGTPLAVVNADAPHEVLRAMGVPYVVNQWWASICAAKQQGDRYLEVLTDLGYPDDVEAYSAIALGSALDPDPSDAPWGGLPPVSLLVGETTTDGTAKIFDVWSRATGARLTLIDATVASMSPRRWFESIHDDWEQVFGSRRLDLMVTQIDDLIRTTEELTGRRFDHDRFAEVMALANEQAEWNRRTRDLVARTRPAPIAVADAIPATMIPQWHRGSEWGRDAAKRLHDEVAARVEAGQAAAPQENARLMWIGRGLWFDMGFYERVQQRHDAVFVWSMYLAIAADAYLRRGGDPRRALAARFCGFADLYNTPPWSSEWYAKEAVHNQIDGVVHLTTDAVRGTHFITRAIEDEGIPVLEIEGSNVDARAWDSGAVEAAVDRFLAERALPHAEAHY
jgi:benzoyl-CoA reductase/2-hydroxyglutaryl-CoA dehydratase subunit BcrC/BadD/HgdB